VGSGRFIAQEMEYRVGYPSG